jgi:uncharacterized protein (DUF2141 family)
MTYILNTLIFLILVLPNAFAETKDTSVGTLFLKVNGIESQQGFLRVSIEQNENQYQSKEDSYRTVSAAPTDEEVIVKIEDLPLGSYTIKVFHDINANNQLDVNALGIPVEPYGISNNARGTFGLPSYRKTLFMINHGDNRHEITVRPHIRMFAIKE